MNALASLHPTATALDRLRDHRQQVARLHDELTAFNSLMAELDSLRATHARFEAAIVTARAERWPDPEKVAALLVDQDSARTALDKFERRNRADLDRADRLQREYAVIAGVQAKQETLTAALDEHFTTVAVEAWADATALHKAAFVILAAAALARHLVTGHRDSAIIGLPMIYKTPVPLNVPASPLLDALRTPEDIGPQVVARAHALIEETNAE